MMFYELGDKQEFKSAKHPSRGVYVRDHSAGAGKICPKNYARHIRTGEVWFFGDPCEVKPVSQ